MKPITLLIALISLTYVDAPACSCIGESTLQSEFKGADAVIVGGLGGGDCGVRFETGQRYIIYGQCESYFGLLEDDLRFSKAKIRSGQTSVHGQRSTMN